MEGIDEIDKAILRRLQLDAKVTIKELASELKLTTSPVHERIKRLENAGYIESYVAVLNKSLLNRSVVAICQVGLEYHNDNFIEKFQQEVAGLGEVHECFHMSGNIDFFLKIYVSTLDEYHDFIRHKLSKINNIKTLTSTIILKEIKNNLAYNI
jgi:Lrp/AsnC family leucine-responsive transcriptional regulator